MALGYVFGVEGFDDEPGLAAHGDFDPFLGRLGAGEIDTIRRLVARVRQPFRFEHGSVVRRGRQLARIA